MVVEAVAAVVAAAAAVVVVELLVAVGLLVAERFAEVAVVVEINSSF